MCRTVSIDHYLKIIYQLQQKNGAVRNADIADALDYSRPSVTRAVTVLEDMGYVTVEDHVIRLTPIGEKEAEILLEKYNTIYSFLISIGISEPSAFHDACELEHSISDETYKKIKYEKVNSQKMTPQEMNPMICRIP